MVSPFWNQVEKKLLRKLNTPRKIQDFLDNTDYSSDEFYRSPRRVMKDNRSHCFDGALFAAAALRNIGFSPLIVDMFAYNDDEHLLAIYKVDGFFGAVAKSNFSGLRFREAIYRNLRELIMSYFEVYYNTAYQKTLRAYSSPLNLSKFDNLNWMISEENLENIADATDKLKRYSLLTPKQTKALSKVDDKVYKAGLLGSDSKGLFIPEI